LSGFAELYNWLTRRYIMCCCECFITDEIYLAQGMSFSVRAEDHQNVV